MDDYVFFIKLTESKIAADLFKMYEKLVEGVKQ